MNPQDRLLTLREVIEVTRLAKPTLYRMMKAGTFPRQIHLATQRVAWLRSEVLDWIARQAAARHVA
jgi:prophage regulatory protein